MIVLRVCACGRTLDPSTWSSLPPTRLFVEDGERHQARRCSCGRELAITQLEDDTAQQIDAAWYTSRNAYGRARLECAMLRAARTKRFASRWDSFKIVRAEARGARAIALQLEAVLASIYRARELRSPMKRLGRNIVVVDGDADGDSPTQRLVRR